MEIEELVQIVTKVKGKKILPVRQNRKELSKFDKATLWLSSGSAKTFEETALKLGYDTDSVAYRMFKSRYLHYLLYQMLDTEIEKNINSDYSKAKFKCSLYMHTVRILVMYSGHFSAKRLCEKIYLISKRYELYEFLLFSLNILRNIEAHNGNINLVERYSKETEVYSKIYFSELESSRCLLTMYAIYSKPKPRNTANISLVEELMKKAERIKKNHSTYNTLLNYYRIRGNYFLLLKDYHSSIQTWESLMSVISKYEYFEYNTRLSEVATYLLTCYLNSKDYDNGLDFIKSSTSSFIEGSLNWFYHHEYHLLLLMHLQEFNQASSLLNAITKHKRFNYLNEARKEKWRIYEAYLYFMTLIIGEPDNSFKKNFQRIIREQSQFSKDKQGIYLSISILYILELARKKDFNTLSDKINSITRLEKKYLADPVFERVKLFIALIKISYENDFYKQSSRKAAKNISIKLDKSVPAYSGNLIGFEILPYETLWEYYLSLLK